eukprot:TRINITY_DN9007_c0_g1_i1.p1 TRINITY_DN9007_c0_g1~~TRINITY_DN9007_c0_g1_i1.p1  ORF type:complete len:746 (+),score=138.13 TRINITY_DN9007_c0_g1_i1:64-2238(+)
MEVTSWTVAQVCEWAVSQGFADLAKGFEDQEIDGETLLELDERGIANFGLTRGKANKLKRAIAELKGLPAVSNAPPTGTMIEPLADGLPAASNAPPTGTAGLPAASNAPPTGTAVPMTNAVPVTQTVLPPAATVVPRAPVPPAGGEARTSVSSSPRKYNRRSTLRRDLSQLGLDELRALPIVKPISRSGEESNVRMDTDILHDLVDTMLIHGQDGDIEVAIVSVMGKFRSGKSFLLNVLVQYFIWLEKNQNRLVYDPRKMDKGYVYSANSNANTDWLPEWLPEEIPTPFCVDAISDTQTCTKGLWILNRPFFLRKPGTDKKMALLLLDSQGADDGVLDESQSRAILGITTVFSSAVVYNVKMPLDVKHVKDLSDLANIFQVAIHDIQMSSGEKLSDEATQFGRLLFLLRDARFREGESFEGCRKKLKQDTANKLDPEQAHINKERVKQLHQSFASPMPGPFGLPHPGDAADFMRSATTNNMRLLNDNFKRLLDDFVHTNFEKNSPVPVNRILKNQPLTATTFIDYLERIKEAFASCMVAGGDPELVTMYHEEMAEEAFVRAVDDLKVEERDYFPKDELEDLKDEAIHNFERFLGNGLTAQAQERWTRRFREFIEGDLAQREARFTIKHLKNDKALAGVAAGAAVLLSPVGPLIYANWIVASSVSGGLVVIGYAKHCREEGRMIGSPWAMKSFAGATVSRTFGLFGASKRIGGRVMSFAGMGPKM